MTPEIASGWQSGIRSGVRLAARMPAIRAGRQGVALRHALTPEQGDHRGRDRFPAGRGRRPGRHCLLRHVDHPGSARRIEAVVHPEPLVSHAGHDPTRRGRPCQSALLTTLAMTTALSRGAGSRPRCRRAARRGTRRDHDQHVSRREEPLGVADMAGQLRDPAGADVRRGQDQRSVASHVDRCVEHGERSPCTDRDRRGRGWPAPRTAGTRCMPATGVPGRHTTGTCRPSRETRRRRPTPAAVRASRPPTRTRSRLDRPAPP